jgi:hypothetical protein
MLCLTGQQSELWLKSDDKRGLESALGGTRDQCTSAGNARLPRPDYKVLDSRSADWQGLVSCCACTNRAASSCLRQQHRQQASLPHSQAQPSDPPAMAQKKSWVSSTLPQ